MNESEPRQMNPDPLVSVVLITYNHAPYIERAIESILEQETSFPVEVLISDDHSTDATREIIDRVVARYQGPHTLVVRHRNPNLGRLGMNNFITTISEARGRYVALLEGDDYWTAKDKIATQAALLEAHPDVTMSGRTALSGRRSASRRKHHPHLLDDVSK
jgi:glycosyltransferase involved in cell wall biosynthesis